MIRAPIRRWGGTLWRRVSGRRNAAYARTVAFLARSNGWPADRMAAWQLRQVNKLLRYACDHSPGHARKLSVGFDGHLLALSDLAGLPFLSKEELRAYRGEFTATNLPPHTLRPVTSGGTTGLPTRFMVEAPVYDQIFQAWRHSMWSRAGFRPGMRALDLTWAFTAPCPVRSSGEPGRQYLSIHALDAPQARDWWPIVSASEPQFIIAFPSTAAAFAKLMPDRKGLPGVRALLLASEILTEHQRAVLTESFPQARIFQWYGMSELAGFASACEHSDALHHWPQSGVIEIVDDAGNPVTRPGEAGEIVLTGFLNRATPFIRFRTGDHGVIGPPCKGCDRSHVVLAAIDGRTSDFLVGRGGRIVPISALNFHSDEFRRVAAHQFVQHEPGRVVLNIAPRNGFSDQDSAAIHRMMHEKVGADLELLIERVPFITRTSRGKQPIIVQHLSRFGRGQKSPL